MATKHLSSMFFEYHKKVSMTNITRNVIFVHNGNKKVTTVFCDVIISNGIKSVKADDSAIIRCEFKFES